MWVSSKGLIRLCDRHNKVIESSTRRVDFDLFDNLDEFTDRYPVIHICSWLSISIFAKFFAPYIRTKVIIVSNDSDFNSPIFDLTDEFPLGAGDRIETQKILDFLNSDFCVHWYCQNCTLVHPKVSPIPIGLDYHTVHQIPSAQVDEILHTIRTYSRPFHDRTLKCYGNFKLTLHSQKYYSKERQKCYDTVNKELCYHENEYQNRSQTWFNQSQYAFVLSPPGGGIDCHRTWEALILGCIPIVKRYTVNCDRLFEDLPVLLIDDWRDVTLDLLTKTVRDFQTRQFKYEKLTLEYYKTLFYKSRK